MTAQTSGSSGYAHGHSASTVQAHSQRTVGTCAAFLLPHLKAGMSVLDVGCGPGSITQGFVDLVKPGRVIGVDNSEKVISAAREAWSSTHSSDQLDFQVADVLDRLPFPDDSFDIVFAHQVLVHLSTDDAPRALREMKRVCKIGGVVGFRDGQPDSGGVQVFPADPLLDKTFEVITKRAYSSGAAIRAAASLKSIARQVGFSKYEREFKLDVWGSEVTRSSWADQWASRSSEEAFKEFALKDGIATEEELDALPQAWRAWSKAEDAWGTLLEIEHLCWK